MTQAARTYNHAYTIAFSVSGSRCEDGEDVTAQQMADALKLRVDDLIAKGHLLHAVGSAYDSFCEQD
jgi:hypothetical protein